MTPPVAPTAKTLPHALSRGSAAASRVLEAAGGPEPRLGQAFKEYSLAYEKIGAARLDQDDGSLLLIVRPKLCSLTRSLLAIVTQFLAPWQVTLNNSIALAVKARQAVRVSRLELDSAKQKSVVLIHSSAHVDLSTPRLKSASFSKQEQTK